MLEFALHPCVGAYLHARNADALGRGDEAKANRVWFNISIGLFVILFILTLIQETFFGSA